MRQTVYLAPTCSTTGVPPLDARSYNSARTPPPPSDLTSLLPPEVHAAVLDLITHPARLDSEDFADLVRGRLGRLCRVGGINPDLAAYHRGLFAAYVGRGF